MPAVTIGDYMKNCENCKDCYMCMNCKNISNGKVL